MKKFLLFIILITFSNCTEDLSNNIPGFEASVDGKDWVAQSYNATVQNNQLSISGNNQLGTISMVIDSININSFELRSWTDDFAVFQDTIYYSTKNDGIGSIAYLSAGRIDIDEIDYVGNSVSGHFYFDAFDGTGQYTINISEGVFYKIPINSVEQD